MTSSDSFGYLKANTMLFAGKMCQSLYDMCGAEMITSRETLREGSFSSPYSIIIFNSFTGAIQGDYLVSLEENVALSLIDAYREGMSDTEKHELREEYCGLLKEALNIAVGQAIEELENSFCDLTFTPSTVVFGKIEFPNIMSGMIEIEGKPGKMQCGFSLNLANLRIGEKLEVTLKELEEQSIETRESRRNIESILELLPIGLVAIDQTGNILPGFSKSTPMIIGCTPDVQVVGRYLPEFVGAPNDLFNEWKNWLNLVYSKFNEIPFSDIVQLCILTEFSNSNNRTLTLKWLPVKNTENDSLDKLLVVIDDVTKQRELEKKMEDLNTRHQENLELISEVINLQPDEVADFIYDSSELLSNAKSIIERNNIDREFINELYRTFHTLKGSSGQYRFKSIQELAHKVEDHLKIFRDGDSQITNQTLDEIRNSINDVYGYINRIQDLRTKLGSKDETLKSKAHRDPQSVMAPLTTIDTIIRQVENLSEKSRNHFKDKYLQEELLDIRKSITSLRSIKLSFFLTSFATLIKNVCEKTGKKANLTVGTDIEIDITLMRKLHQCFIHLINNAIDHGIESPEKRLKAGKIETGVLVLSGEKHPDSLIIHISDDGDGLDINRIKSFITSRYNLSDDEVNKMQKNELYQFLYKPGFTTKSEVSMLSGRGVGMDFVNHTITALGGTVNIETAAGKGTTVTLSIPRE